MERVPDNVPVHCDMVVWTLGQNKVQYVSKMDSIAFKYAIRNSCPCSQGRLCASSGTTPGTKFKIHTWFDGAHRKLSKNLWPYIVKYPCDSCGSPVGYSMLD